MAETKEKKSWNAHDYKFSLIRIKSLTTVALNHLKDVKGEPLPADTEFGEILSTLAMELVEAVEHLDEMAQELHIPSLDSPD